MITTLIIIGLLLTTIFFGMTTYMAGFIRCTRLFTHKNITKTKFEKNLIAKLIKDDPQVDEDLKGVYLKAENDIITDAYKKRLQFLQDLENGKLDETIKKEAKIKPTKKRKSNAKRKK